MGVYIKNMKAPVTCSYCPLIGYDPNIEWNDGGRETQGAYICVLTHELIDNTKREDHCPLVPVPPHGRLVDIADVQYALIMAGQHSKRYKLGETWELNLREIMAALETVPTIIPAEEGEA